MNNQLKQIRSFVKRAGRLSRAQECALREQASRYCLPVKDEPYDLGQVFARQAPKILEIGFGMGDSLAEMAAAHPEYDYLGVEVHDPGVGALLKRAAEQNLTNIKVFSEDVNIFLKQGVKEHSFSKVQIYFPDPWPKRRHHKRRLIQSAFLDCLKKTLKAGAIIHIATDWAPYAEHIRAVFEEHPAFEAASKNSVGFARPETKFERRGKRLGHQIWEGYFSYNTG